MVACGFALPLSVYCALIHPLLLDSQLCFCLTGTSGGTSVFGICSVSGLFLSNLNVWDQPEPYIEIHRMYTSGFCLGHYDAAAVKGGAEMVCSWED